MSWWQLGALSSAVISVAYLAISAIVFTGLTKTGQLKTNPLAFMTGVIFFSCGIGHGLHGYHLIIPGQSHMGMGMRDMWTGELAIWDTITAGVAVTYLALRRRYGQLLNTPQMFQDQVERAAARELREVLRELREGVIVLNRDGGVEHLNDEARELLRRAGLDAAGLQGARALHGDHRLAVVERVRLSGEPCDDVEIELVGADGEARLLRLSARPLDSGGEAPFRVVLSFANLTDRMRADAEARALSTRVNATLEALAEGVVFYDAELIRRSVNGAGRDILGEGAQDYVDVGVEDTRIEAFHADGRPMGADEWPAVVAHRTGQLVKDVELGFKAPGAPMRWVSANASPIVDAEHPGGPWPVVVSFTDITERVARERALVEAEQRVRSTFDAAPVGMRVAALDGTYVEVNKSFADLLGTTVAELVGRRGADVTHPDDVADEAEGTRRLVEGEITTFRMEKRFLHAAGHAVWTQIDLTALRDADGRAIATIGQIQDISDRRRHDEQLRHLADHDALTGLLNRRGFQRELERHVEQSERYGTAGALLMLDLDHFKYVNDTLGHKAGDELIVAVADVLRSRLRKTDVIARLGGDEFAVLLPRGTREEAGGAAESVLRSLRDRQAQLPTFGRLKLSASIGIAVLDDPTLTADELLVNADLAMYDAKEAGRDQVADYASGRYKEPRIKSRITWMERINAALEHDRFTLFAQPIHDLGSETVAMHELLLRMHGEGGDLIPPATFLYIAERFDLVQDIDRWVIARACELLRDSGGATTLSVNVSAKSMNDPDALLTHIAGSLDRCGVEPSSLVVEITETAAVTQIHHARTFARDLRRMGCRLAIDDFGAGFGSFYYLKHLPFDYLKIDGEFVTHARTSKPDHLIVAALRDMAHGLDRKVIGEYCADPETLEYLRDEGIDFAQGFHLGRPAPAESVLPLAH